ncbi:MAG: alanine:cation symporter family protein [Oscillibacter sp.]
MKQGLWGISEVFVDTIIVCTMTALVVLCTGGGPRAAPARPLTAPLLSAPVSATPSLGIGVRGGHHHLLRLHHRAGQCVLR